MMNYLRSIGSGLLRCIACILLMLGGLHASQAQLAGSTQVSSPLPPPPAFAIATRLYNQHDYNGAIKKLNDVSSSATYKNTPYAPEAIYSAAHIYEADLHDDNSAMGSLNQLVNNYQHVKYSWPHQGVVVAEKEALGGRIDAENRANALKGPANWFDLPQLWYALSATGYVVVDFFVRLTGSQNYSYWLALLLISVVIRLLMWPLSIKQYKSMKEMQRLQPLLKELQAKHANDRMTLATKQQELMKEHGVNPAAGCLPMLMQIPVFFYMAHAVWLYQYRFSHGTFLWITPSLHRLAPNFIGANLADQDIILLALYSLSMYVTQRMMPMTSTDPQQIEMQKNMAGFSAILFFFMFQNYHLSSAFILYYLFSNVVGSLVQIYVMRQSGYMQPAVADKMIDGDNTVVVEAEKSGSGAKNGNGKAGSNNNGSGSAKVLSNGANGTARGMIAPKVHPKKKRR